jgi:acetylornithine deacetylase/succinyl-diaminopimelate desuccinylase-like protein
MEISMQDRALKYAASHQDQFLAELREFLSIPSISAQPKHKGDMERAAKWLANHLKRIGLADAKAFPTSGHPIVTGEWMGAGPRKPTLLIYGHYDVQPPEPFDLWKTQPFRPTVRGDNLYARGASDDKGQVFAHIKMVESYLRTEGHLPVNVKFLIEGEEEVGGPSLTPFIESHKRQLACKVALISDSSMPSPSQPAITYGLRGICYMQVELEGPDHDLHSGSFGGAVYNPIQALAEMIAKMKDAKGHITIPGFYDKVRAVSNEERRAINNVPFDQAEFCRDAGVSSMWGEVGYTIPEQIGIRPTLECNGIWGGYMSEGSKTVLPSKAYAKISMRLVPDQTPEEIAHLFSDYVRRVAPPQVKVTIQNLHGGLPALIDRDIPEMQAASAALERAFGAKPVFMRDGGSVPVVAAFKSILGAPTIMIGLGLPDDNLHSPNEKFYLPNFYKGIDASIHFLDELAQM